ncbi:MAG: glycosyltransferase family 2 protein [Muribaculaceae bacterium]|nr:glycosyltransferase family 2 protein [Muribaculaceae bacterium]
MAAREKIAILIPCYNESLTIAGVIEDYRRQYPTANIYVYDNNSTDDTASIARAAGAEVRHVSRQGKGNVVAAMLTDIEADCYLITDGDDTYPAADTIQLVDDVLHHDIDMAIGDRLSSSYFTENRRPFHNSGNRLVRWLINRIFNTSVNDIMTGSRALSYRFAKNFPAMSPGFEIETEMTIHALDKGFNISEHPVGYRDRPQGSISKLSTFRDGMKVLRTIFMLFRDFRPLQFFSILSAVITLISLIMAIPVFVEYFETGLVPRFPTLIFSGFLFIFAMLLFATGLILDSIKRRDRVTFRLRMIDFSRLNKH